MTDPLVVSICLTRDRPAMTRRAVSAFHAMPYQPMRLLILDTSENEDCTLYMERHRVSYRHLPDFRGKSIGELRNEANDWACEFDAEIIAHLDSDDVSHANRMAEQVALLQASGAECVGYNECLFWDTRWRDTTKHSETSPTYVEGKGSAYIYRNYSPEYCIGSSMMYLASTWQRVKFDHINQGEDGRFLQRVKSVGVSSLREVALRCEPIQVGPCFDDPLPHFMRYIPGPVEARPGKQLDEPRMICSIHGGNTSHYNPEGERNSYTRAPEFDAHCERIMKL